MFFVSFTNDPISGKFCNVNLKLKDIKLATNFATIITDGVLSKYSCDSTGFSVVETLLDDDTCYEDDAVLSKVSFVRSDNCVEIYKPFISGRPIYYHTNSQGEFYCSTHIWMLRKAGVIVEENTSVLPEFFIYRYIMPPQTLYKNIKQLSFGSRLHLKLTNRKTEVVSVSRYKPPLPEGKNRAIEDVSAHTLSLIKNSFETLTSQKDYISVLLSGGIDSSIMTKICQESFGINEAYATGYPFEDPRLNLEKEYSESAGTLLGIHQNYYESPSQDYLFGLLESINLAEIPVHHLQSVCLHLLFKNGIPSKKEILVMAPGAGALFGNFRNHFYLNGKLIFELLSKPPVISMLKCIANITGRGHGFTKSLNLMNKTFRLDDTTNPIWDWHAYGSKEWVCEYFKVSESDIIKSQYEFLSEYKDREICDIWSLYTLLGDEDATYSIWSKIAEGNKKKLFDPYYDLHVQDYVFSVPWKTKLKRPENALRKEIAHQCKIPNIILNRPKMGFGVKTKNWSIQGGAFEPLVPLASKVFPEKEIRKMQSTDNKKAGAFWNILNYSIWKRLYIDNEPLDILFEELEKSISDCSG